MWLSCTLFLFQFRFFWENLVMFSVNLQKLICRVLAVSVTLLGVGYPVGSAQAVIVDPVTSGMIENLDANRGVTQSSGSVSYWANQSATGGDDMFQTAPAAAPTFNSSGPNGQDSLTFTATSSVVSDYLAGTSLTAFDAITQGSGYTWFAVINPGTQYDNSVSHSFMGDLVNGPWWGGMTGRVSGASNQPVTQFRDAGGNDSTFTSSSGISGWTIVEGRLQAGLSASPGIWDKTNYLDVNGVNAGSTTATVSASDNADNLTIGKTRSADAAGGYTGRVGRPPDLHG